MKKNWIILTMGILIPFTSCSEKKETVSAGEETLKIKVAQAQNGSLTPELVYSGSIQANKDANIGASLPGKVEKIYCQEGDFVKKGDLLAEMSAELYTQAMAEFIAVKKDYERVERLYQKSSVSEQEYDHVKALYNATAEKVEMLKKNTRITAPFDGIVVEYLVKEGENYFFSPSLEPGYSMTSGIVKLMQINPAKVVFEVNEKDLKYIKKGTEILIVSDILSVPIPAKVSRIKPALSMITRSASVEATFMNPGNKLFPGMSAEVRVALSPVQGVIIPDEGLYQRKGSSVESVFVVKDNQVKEVQVKCLLSRNGSSVIQGIEPGCYIAVTKKDKLFDGCKVEVVGL